MNPVTNSVQAEVAQALSQTEKIRLEQIEQSIELSLRSSYAGYLEIRETRLYRESYGTFEEYCLERWGITSRRANQIISVAKVENNLGTNGSQTLPILTERVLRPLTKIVEPDEQVKVFEEAVATAPNGKLTGRHVESVVQKHHPKPTPRPSPPQIIPAVIPEPEPEPEPEEEKPFIAPTAEEYDVRGDAYEDPDDEEWLASLPLSSKLIGVSLKTFRADALLYRELEKHRKLFGHHAAIQMNIAKQKGGRKGSYLYRLNSFLEIEHPKKWQCCKPTNKGGCDGVGTVGKETCSHKLCYGRGYWIVGAQI